MNATPLFSCSTNRGKLAEFSLAASACGDYRYCIEPLPGLEQIPPPEENGITFEENAAIKATYYSRATAKMVFADDSGLEVDALGGAPGVFSARFAGPGATDQANNDLLLAKLAFCEQRSARFVSVIAAAQSGRLLGTFRGTVEGVLLAEPRGTLGFGYDPLFFYPPLGRTLAELAPEEKFRVSHRGQAMCRMLAALG